MNNNIVKRFGYQLLTENMRCYDYDVVKTPTVNPRLNFGPNIQHP